MDNFVSDKKKLYIYLTPQVNNIGINGKMILSSYIETIDQINKCIEEINTYQVFPMSILDNIMDKYSILFILSDSNYITLNDKIQLIKNYPEDILYCEELAKNKILNLNIKENRKDYTNTQINIITSAKNYYINSTIDDDKIEESIITVLTDIRKEKSADIRTELDIIVHLRELNNISGSIETVNINGNIIPPEDAIQWFQLIVVDGGSVAPNEVPVNKMSVFDYNIQFDSGENIIRKNNKYKIIYP